MIKALDQGWSETFGPQGIYNKISMAAVTNDGASYIGFRKLMFGYLFIVLLVWWGFYYLSSSRGEFGFEEARVEESLK